MPNGELFSLRELKTRPAFSKCYSETPRITCYDGVLGRALLDCFKQNSKFDAFCSVVGLKKTPYVQRIIQTFQNKTQKSRFLKRSKKVQIWKTKHDTSLYQRVLAPKEGPECLGSLQHMFYFIKKTKKNVDLTCLALEKARVS